MISLLLVLRVYSPAIKEGAAVLPISSAYLTRVFMAIVEVDVSVDSCEVDEGRQKGKTQKVAVDILQHKASEVVTFFGSLLRRVKKPESKKNKQHHVI